MTYEDWLKELDFIKGINATYPPKEFDYNRALFAEYCNLQANSALFENHRQIAMEIIQYRDIAQPDYRQCARQKGNFVYGSFVFYNLQYTDKAQKIINVIKEENSLT